MRKKPVQQRSQQMVDALIEAAGQVIAERGLEHFTTVQVAERANVSVGSLYQYFANKDALLAALVDRLNREMGEMVSRIAPSLLQADPQTLVRGLLHAAFDFLGGREGLYMELLRNWYRLDIQRSLHRFEQQMLEITRAYALTHVADLRLDHGPAKGFVIINSVVFTLLRYLSLPNRALFDRDRLVEELTTMVAGYLSADRPRNPRSKAATVTRAKPGTGRSKRNPVRI